MTPEQQTQFRHQGYLFLPGALAGKAVQPVRTHILNELKRQRIWSGGRSLSQRLKGVPAFQQVVKLGQWLGYPGLKERLVTTELYALMCRLAGAPALSAEQEAQLLLSLPHRAEWSLEGLNWHRDIARSDPAVIPGVQAFFLVDDLAPRGGATLALAGSHRLTRESQGRQGMDALARRAGTGTVKVDGIELSILEMTGRAGDAYLMDMRLAHTPSLNATRNVRMMATIRYLTG